MLRDVFSKSLRDQTRSVLSWTLGGAIYIVLLIALYPSLRKSMGSVQGYVNSLPKAIKAAFLGSAGDFASPTGYVDTELLSWLIPIIFIAFAVAAGARALAGEEETGTLSLLLAYPIDRTRLVLQKYAAFVCALAIVAAGCLAAVLVMVNVTNMGVAAGRLALAVAATALIALVVGSLAFVVAAATGRRTVGVGAGAAAAGAMYLFNTVAQINSTLHPLEHLSLFHYAGSPTPLATSMTSGGLAVFAAATAALLGLAVVLFGQRDVTV